MYVVGYKQPEPQGFIDAFPAHLSLCGFGERGGAGKPPNSPGSSRHLAEIRRARTHLKSHFMEPQTGKSRVLGTESPSVNQCRDGCKDVFAVRSCVECKCIFALGTYRSREERTSA